MAEFSMNEIYITDNIKEQIEIGRKIYCLKASRYTSSLLSSIRETIQHHLPKATEKEYEDVFFRSIYDYWVYGSSIQEEFYFDFLHKTDEQKKTYITIMEHVLYCEHLNRQEDSHLLMNKYETYCLLKDYYKRDVICIKEQSDYPAFCDFIEKHRNFVVKPTDSWQAQGVYKECFSGTTDHEKRCLFNQLLWKGRHYKESIRGAKESSLVLEEIIDQGEELAKFHPESVNCVRCNTIRIGDQTIIYRPSLKMGIHGNFVSSGFLRCPIAGINAETGVIETPGVTEDLKTYEFHPDTQLRIIGSKIPCWDELKELAIDIAGRFPTIRIVGWDLAWSKHGWCVMEGNEKPEFGWQRTWGFPGKKEFEDLIGWKPDKDFWWK